MGSVLQNPGHGLRRRAGKNRSLPQRSHGSLQQIIVLFVVLVFHLSDPSNPSSGYDHFVAIAGS
jgi:hypothetical protein